MPTYQPAEHAVFREIDELIIALNLDTGEYFTMNEVAARMWTLLTTNDSIEETVIAIVAEYDVTAEQAERDLAGLLAELTANDLIYATV